MQLKQIIICFIFECRIFIESLYLSTNHYCNHSHYGIISTLYQTLNSLDVRYVVIFHENYQFPDCIVSRINSLGKYVEFANEGYWNKDWESMPDEYLFLVWTNVSLMESIIKEGRKQGLFRPLFKWIIILPTTFSIETDIGNYLTHSDSVILFHNDLLKSSNVLIYKWSNSTVENIGHFSNGKINLQKHIFQKYPNFEDYQFFVAIVPVDFIQMKKTKIKDQVFYVGLFVKILDLLAEKLKFRYKLLEPDNLQFGIIENGSWNGAIGMLDNKKADLAIGPYNVLEQRLEAVDFMTAVGSETLAIIMKRPDHKVLSSFFITKPLKPEVWYSYLAFVILAFAFIYLYTKLDVHENNMRVYSEYSVFRLSLWYAICASLNQGSVLPNSKNSSVRILVAFVWITTVVVIAIYTGNLIAFLSVRKAKLPVETLEDAVTNSEFRLVILGSSAHEFLFKTAKTGVFRKAWEKIEKDLPYSIVYSLKDGLERAKNQNTGFVNERSVMNLVSHMDCDYVTTPVENDFHSRSIAFPVQKHWPYLETFNNALQEVVIEGGYVEKWKTDLNLTEPANCESQERIREAVHFHEIIGVLYLFSIGLTISVIVLFIEKTFYRIRYRLFRNKVGVN
ncbi:DgyrCDS10267 [Dimorphilus gyrociliatus]|uniref:DgyrCDS10267 n=1 Tax=Dimorphilus gyrociliatus TaxID=2664684 RepID=A0A7I8VZW7_9ANNE|nr:DgyrCDS10267 [Dimorphilus gyrociliatus]